MADGAKFALAQAQAKAQQTTRTTLPPFRQTTDNTHKLNSSRKFEIGFPPAVDHTNSPIFYFYF
jgi:hypothetical protein